VTQPAFPDDAVTALARQVARIDGERARLVDQLAEGERRLRTISRGVLRIQEAERGRISRELHDGVGQSLTALKVQLELMERAAVDGPSAERLQDLRQLAERTLQEVRQISHLLRPQMLDELGLVPTLRWLTRTFQQRTGIAVELVCEGLEGDLPPDLETLVFRVAQESLANVARHAKAPKAAVHVRRSAGRLFLAVRDDGAGFDVESALRAGEDGRGSGLRGMRDRIQLFRGRFSVRSAPGAGATVEVEVPLDVDGEGRRR
jgi:two-component system, NarL family, sensor kinase